MIFPSFEKNFINLTPLWLARMVTLHFPKGQSLVCYYYNTREYKPRRISIYIVKNIS